MAVDGGLAEVRAIGATNLNTAAYPGRDLKVATVSLTLQEDTLGIDGPTWSASAAQ